MCPGAAPPPICRADAAAAVTLCALGPLGPLLCIPRPTRRGSSPHAPPPPLFAPGAHGPTQPPCLPPCLRARQAFELLPSSANFGTLKAGSLYRLKLKLVNVSNLPQVPPRPTTPSPLSRRLPRHARAASRLPAAAAPPVRYAPPLRYSPVPCVSPLPQRFRFEAHGSAAASGHLKLVYTPGVAAPGVSVPVEVEVGGAEPLEIREVVTAMTEREEISLPISAKILDEEAYGEYIASSAPRRGPLAPRLVSTSLRDPGLYKIQSSRVGDASAGALMGLAPKTRGKQPDFFGEPLSDGEEAPEEDDGGD